MTGSTVYGSNVPGMKQLVQITKNQPQVTHYIRGYVSMMVLTEALKIADKKGQLNGPGVKAALESLKDFDTGGLTPAKITFTPTDHRPSMTVNIMEFQKGKMVLKQSIELPRKKEWLGL
jgi:branched-chain amino acid transport system substrate-binding protein